MGVNDRESSDEEEWARAEDTYNLSNTELAHQTLKQKSKSESLVKKEEA